MIIGKKNNYYGYKRYEMHKANLIIINLMEKNKLRNTVWHECGHKTGHFIGPFVAI